MLGGKREEISMIIYDTIFSSDIYLKYLRNQYPSTGSRGKGQMTKERHPPSCLSPDPDWDWTKTQIYRLTPTRKISLRISTNWRERKKERQDCERKKVFETLLAVWEFTREREHDQFDDQFDDQSCSQFENGSILTTRVKRRVIWGV